MGFFEAVRSVLGKYATFSGRARRAEYWWFTLFNVLASIIAQGLDQGVNYATYGHGDLRGGLFELAVGLGLFLPGIAVWCRRLHDVGRSGWWWLLVLVPVIGWIVLFYWSVRRGDVGANDYGPDPIGGSDDYITSDIPRVTRR